jgi:hypothetical protein
LIVVAVLALALVGVLGAVVGGKMLQQPGQSAPGQLVQAPGAAGAGALVQAPAQTNPVSPVQAPADTRPPAIIQAPGQPVVNTADIDDYLKFVRQIETLKQKLIHDELGNALEMMTKAQALGASIDEDQYNNTFKGIGDDTNKIADQWNQLSKRFEERTPPQACIELHNTYADQLAKIQAQVVAVHSALNKVQSDPSNAIHALTAMSGTASAEADSAAQAADDALSDVCKRYNLSKDFSIRTDSGSASLLR